MAGPAGPVPAPMHYTRSSDVLSLGLVMFVICELPDPLEPMAYFLGQLSQWALGQLMQINIAAKCIPATLLLKQISALQMR